MLLLRGIQTQDELKAAIPKLRKSYLRWARLVVQVRRLQEDAKPAPASQASDELFAELARLCELPGGRELLGLAQAEAVKLLDDSLRGADGAASRSAAR